MKSLSREAMRHVSGIVIASALLAWEPADPFLSAWWQEPPPKVSQNKQPSQSKEKEKNKEKEKKEAEARDPTIDPEAEMLDRAAIELRKNEHRRAVDASEEILKRARQLKETLSSGHLPKNSDGILEAIEKLAKRIMSISGAGSTEEKEPLPDNLNEAVQKLSTRAELLNEVMKKLTPYAISLEAINDSDAIIRLSRHIRQMIHGTRDS